MLIYWSILTFCFLLRTHAWSDNRIRRFKDDFLFGVGTAAYQIEGAWDADGKGESIWDRYAHTYPERILEGRGGDVAADSYHQYKRDVEMLRELGVDVYRFSIAWTRVLPTGLTTEINEKGLEYYDNLIDELLKYNIEPVVTLYHFDLPQKLQDLGGWVNPDSVNWYTDYARFIFNRYACKVKFWITFNQPSFCLEGYGSVHMAPGIDEKGTSDYICLKNVMVAHAKSYRLYEKEFKKKNRGTVGISMSVNWADPVNNSTDNENAAEAFRQFTIDFYIHPIFSKAGDFPQYVKDVVAKRSKLEGLSKSRLPEFTKEEIKLLRGSADFLGINHYTTFLVSPSDPDVKGSINFGDIEVDLAHGQQWASSRSPWLKSAPYGLYKASLYINKHYDYPPVLITENGWSSDVGLQDTGRVDHMKGIFNALLLAIEDGTDVKGYLYWSLMDNVEWTAGTSERFGLYEVDFDSDNKTRRARQSALFYKDVIETRAVDQQWKPTRSNIDISDRRLKKKKTKMEL